MDLVYSALIFPIPYNRKNYNNLGKLRTSIICSTSFFAPKKDYLYNVISAQLDMDSQHPSISNLSTKMKEIKYAVQNIGIDIDLEGSPIVTEEKHHVSFSDKENYYSVDLHTESISVP